MTEIWDDAKIREAFIYDGGEAEYYDPINGAKEQRRRAGEVFDRWLAAHDAEVRARVVAEEPEWGTERIEEARIYYRYGVNSGTLTTLNTPKAIARAVEDHERRTMGRIGVEKIEARTKVTHTSPWVPVKQEDEEKS